MNQIAFHDQIEQRHKRLFAAMSNQGIDALVLNPGPSLVYLTGLHFHLSERPVVTIFTPDKEPLIVLPQLETTKLTGLSFGSRSFSYSDDPDTWLDAFKKAVQAGNIDGRVIGIEPGRLRVLELRYLEKVAPQAHFISAAESLESLRISKDKDEISAMRRAVDIAQNALIATIPSIKLGASEQEIASELTLQLYRAGSEPQLPFFPIVSSGKNTANPHATPSERTLQSGDLLVIDWGASYKGYASDITRTFALGLVDEELAYIAEIVLQANEAGRKAASPGVSAASVDKAARDVIEAAGYGDYFIHRTGHGLGMESHEAPYIRSGNLNPLELGMTFTVEPGIYLPDRGGVRIEDDVLITADGSESLTSLQRQLHTINE